MTTNSKVVEDFFVNLKCKKAGHETMPIIYVCDIGTCKDRVIDIFYFINSIIIIFLLLLYFNLLSA